MEKIKNIFSMIKNKILNKVKKDMETKTNKRNNLLLEEYNKGRILQVDNKIDNKEFLKAK